MGLNNKHHHARNLKLVKAKMPRPLLAGQKTLASICQNTIRKMMDCTTDEEMAIVLSNAQVQWDSRWPVLNMNLRRAKIEEVFGTKDLEGVINQHLDSQQQTNDALTEANQKLTEMAETALRDEANDSPAMTVVK
jgi:hypothetical protein